MALERGWHGYKERSIECSWHSKMWATELLGWLYGNFEGVFLLEVVCGSFEVESKTAPNLLLSVVPFKVLKRWSLVQGYCLLASFESVSCTVLLLFSLVWVSLFCLGGGVSCCSYCNCSFLSLSLWLSWEDEGGDDTNTQDHSDHNEGGVNIDIVAKAS